MTEAGWVKAIVAPILKLERVSVCFGAVQALKEVSLEVQTGQILTVIGANGAGKSSLLRAVSGLVKPASGKIYYRDELISGLAPHRIAGRGISQAPEGRGIFQNLSVEENLDLGAWSAPDQRRLAQDFDEVYALFPRLKDRRRQSAGTLSGGEQQMLAIGRALMAQPQLLLLDEPSLGLAPRMIDLIFETVEAIARKGGKSVLLIEQNAVQSLRIADRGLVLEAGKVVTEAAASALLSSRAVFDAYLGGGFA